MNLRIVDSTSNSDLKSRINMQRGRISVLNERIATGKRINRPSDDPGGTQKVLNLRTSQVEIEQFKANAHAASQKLTFADDSLNGYETVMDRVRTLVAQGMSGTGTPTTQASIAAEVESLRGRVLNIANTKNGNEYIFGGTRQIAPPFDPVTAVPAATPTTAQYVQIEPGTNAIAVGVTADKIFADATSNIFTDLDAAIAALRGTGDPIADRATLESTMGRLSIYRDQVTSAHATVGANMNATDLALDNLTMSSLALDERASSIEDADYAETALGLADAQRNLDAILQIAARGTRSMFDFMG
jgi:flagellar hook-associated protein 3 FlgL